VPRIKYRKHRESGILIKPGQVWRVTFTGILTSLRPDWEDWQVTHLERGTPTAVCISSHDGHREHPIGKSQEVSIGDAGVSRFWSIIGHPCAECGDIISGIDDYLCSDCRLTNPT
jgi:hypothetical protein